MIGNQKNNSITIWDSNDDPAQSNELIYTWNGYAEKGSIRSLLQYIEKHGNHIRYKYLSWVHSLGESKINGKRIIDHLAFDDEFSYWWMTLLAEKSPWKSPKILEAIRLIALEEIIIEENPAQVRFVSSNKEVNEAIALLCKNLKIKYEWTRLPNKLFLKFNLKLIFCKLPQPLQAMIRLVRYIFRRWVFTKAKKTDWFSGDKSLLICSYFFNNNSKLAKKGHFHSHFWESFPNLLKNLNISANWLQNYIPHDSVPNPKVAVDLIQGFNRNSKGQGVHNFLDSFLTRRIVICVFKGWLKLIFLSWKMRRIENLLRENNNPLFFLWVILKNDWYESMRGAVSIDNLLWLELFNEALGKIPYQKMGLYLCEGQAWERALIHAWRKQGHGKLIGSVHSIIRFWGLPYFFDRRTIQCTTLNPIPLPDIISINGKPAMDALLSSGYPRQIFAECEALRFGYLNNMKVRPRNNKIKKEFKVLILGDYDSLFTVKMLKLLEEAIPKIKNSMTYTIKFHPNFKTSLKTFPSLNLKIVLENLEEVLSDFDIAYTSCSTSAAVDAYLAGLPVVVMQNETELNFSPLKDKKDVCFVNTPGKLAEEFNSLSLKKYDMQIQENEFFFYDPKLSRWEELLLSI